MNIYSDKIYSLEEIYQIINNLIFIYNVEDQFTKLVFVNYNYLARYCIKSRRLLINYNKIIEYLYIKSKLIKLNIFDIIKYINLGFLKIILHEIKHMIQEKEKENLIIHACKNEEYLKSIGTYSSSKYYNNPIERQANIFSSRELITNYFFDCDLKKNYISEFKNEIKYGYENGKSPVESFFRNYVDFSEISKCFDGKGKTFDQKVESGLILNSNERLIIKKYIIGGVS